MKKVSIVLAIGLLALCSCAAQNTVTVKRNRAGQVVKLETNADSAMYRNGKETIALDNREAWDMFWSGIGGLAGNVNLGLGMTWVNQRQDRRVHRNSVNDTLQTTSESTSTVNRNENYSGQVDVDHNYSGAVDINGTGGWDSDHHLIWGP